LAEEGFLITRLHRRQLRWCLASLTASPVASRLFLKDGEAYEIGDLFRQPELARTLRRMAKTGTEDFYHGQIARDIAADMQRHGGLMSFDDLAEFQLPADREPLTIQYRGYQVISNPPPGGGLQVLLGLKLLERLDLGDAPLDPTQWYEVMAETIHTVFQERERQTVPHDGYSFQDYRRLLSDERADQLAATIQRAVWPVLQKVAAEEPGDTTHLCTADDQGTVVSLTQSIQSLWGAKVANERCGFLYNNYLHTCPRYEHPHQLRGGCTPRSNAAPTLILEGDLHGSTNGRPHPWRPLLALGGAGTRRMTSAILQTISGVIDRRLSVAEAVAEARIHVKLSRKVWLEKPADTQLLCSRLEQRFRVLEVRKQHSYAMGAVQAIQFHADGSLAGAADPRREGTAMHA
jgi:gamma-glutamyltranspeptidase/glutathione hydrolase